MFGDTFNDLYESASEKARAAADAMGEAWDDTKQAAGEAYDATAEATRDAYQATRTFASETYDAAKTKGAAVYKSTAEATTVAVDRVKETASDVAEYTAEKYDQAKTVASEAKDAFVDSATRMRDAAVDSVVQTCNQAKQNWKDNTEDTGWQFADSVEGHVGAEAAPDEGFESGSGVQAGVNREMSSSLKRWGDEDDNISLGKSDASALLGAKYDNEEGEFTAGAFLDASTRVLSAEGDLEFEKQGIELEGGGELLGLGAELDIGFQKSDDFTGGIVKAGAEAVLVKVEGEATIAITPKTIYDNTIGNTVDFFWPGSDYASAPDYLDHGLVIGAGGELGVAAAAEAEGYIGKKDGAWGIGGKAKAGAGPMAGIKLFLGIK